MGAIETATQVEPLNDPDDSAGYRLRSAREQLGLSIREVASALNLMVSHVRGIETDRYAELTNDKQFLRHVSDYATLVDLEADEIVDIYRLQSAAVAAQIEARPAKYSRQYDSKWYAVGALAIACVCLGIWALNQTLPAKSTKPGNETAQQKPAATQLPADQDKTAKNKTVDTSKPAGSPTISVPTTIASREQTTAAKGDDKRGADETTARSDQAALETTQTQPGKNTKSVVPAKAIAGKNALLAIGAKPLKKTLVKLKNDV